MEPVLLQKNKFFALLLVGEASCCCSQVLNWNCVTACSMSLEQAGSQMGSWNFLCHYLRSYRKYKRLEKLSENNWERRMHICYGCPPVQNIAVHETANVFSIHFINNLFRPFSVTWKDFSLPLNIFSYCCFILDPSSISCVPIWVSVLRLQASSCWHQKEVFVPIPFLLVSWYLQNLFLSFPMLLLTPRALPTHRWACSCPDRKCGRTTRNRSTTSLSLPRQTRACFPVSTADCLCLSEAFLVSHYLGTFCVGLVVNVKSDVAALLKWTTELFGCAAQELQNLSESSFFSFHCIAHVASCSHVLV